MTITQKYLGKHIITSKERQAVYLAYDVSSVQLLWDWEYIHRRSASWQNDEKYWPSWWEWQWARNTSSGGIKLRCKVQKRTSTAQRSLAWTIKPKRMRKAKPKSPKKRAQSSTADRRNSEKFE